MKFYENFQNALNEYRDTPPIAVNFYHESNNNSNNNNQINFYSAAITLAHCDE